MIKRIIIILTMIISCTSCISYTELNDMGIINAIGIDKHSNEYLVSINMIVPNDNNKQDIKSFIVKDTNLDQAINKLYEKSLRRIYMSHIDLLLPGDDLDKEDYDDIINLFLNRNDSRNTFSTIIVQDFDINKISNIVPKDINSLIKVNSEETSIVRIKQFDEVIKDIFELKSSLIPRIKIEGGLTLLGYKQVYSTNKNLSKEESLAYNFITNNIKMVNIFNNDINFKVNSSITKIDINKNKIIINIYSSINVVNNNDIKDKDKLKNIYKEKIKKMLDNYINNNDLAYFYDLAKKYDYTYYKNSDKLDLNFEYKIEVSINNNSNTIGGKSYGE